MRVSASTSYRGDRSNLVDCVKSGLSLTGEASASVIEYHLSSRFGIALEDVPADPTQFIDGMLTMFGEGAKPIFLSIIRELLLCSYRGIEFSPLVSALTGALKVDSPPASYLGRPSSSASP